MAQRRLGQSDLYAHQNACGLGPEGLPIHSACDRRDDWAAGRVSQQRSHYAQHPDCSARKRQLQIRPFPGAHGGYRAACLSRDRSNDSRPLQQSPLDGSDSERCPEPLFAVSKPNGAYEIHGLPPGTYTLVAMHEKLGTQSQQITIQSHKASKANLPSASDASTRTRLL